MNWLGSLRRTIWNLAIALAAPWVAAVVWGLVFASAEDGLLERIVGSAAFTVYDPTTPTILAAALLVAIAAKVRGSRPARGVLVAVVGGATVVQFIAYHMWRWQQDALATNLAGQGSTRLALAFVVGGLAAGAVAGGLVRVGQAPDSAGG